MKDNRQTILDEFNKAVKMGEDSYAMVIEKATDGEFKSLLQKQSQRYEDFLEKVHHEYERLGQKPADTPITEKIMGWTGIQMNTLTDSSNSHLAEMLIQGANMGVIECTKLLNSDPEMEMGLHHLIDQFITLQNDVTKELKPFMKL